jgi:hypothetical protein
MSPNHILHSLAPRSRWKRAAGHDGHRQDNHRTFVFTDSQDALWWTNSWWHTLSAGWRLTVEEVPWPSEQDLLTLVYQAMPLVVQERRLEVLLQGTPQFTHWMDDQLRASETKQGRPKWAPPPTQHRTAWRN